jgi:flagellar capping protein FliD
MTIDERLERLTERHEALTQIVEMLATRAGEEERRITARFDRLSEIVEHLVQVVINHEGRVAKLEQNG